MCISCSLKDGEEASCMNDCVHFILQEVMFSDIVATANDESAAHLFSDEHHSRHQILTDEVDTCQFGN